MGGKTNFQQRLITVTKEAASSERMSYPAKSLF